MNAVIVCISFGGIGECKIAYLIRTCSFARKVAGTMVFGSVTIGLNGFLSFPSFTQSQICACGSMRAFNDVRVVVAA